MHFLYTVMSTLDQKRLLTLLILIISIPLSGQNIFREGYIVKTDGKVLTGLVQYKNSNYIPEKCIFKRFEISEPVVISKTQITEFGYINGNRYVLRRYLGNEMFMELLVSGKISLYRNNDGYYLEKGDSKLIKLTAGDITLYESGSKIVIDGAEKLLEHFTEGKVNPIQKETIKIKESLINKVIEYNKISGSTFLVTNREFDDSRLVKQALVTGSNRNRYGIMIGTDMPMFFSPAEERTLPTLINMSTWGAGVSIERIISRKNDRLSAGTEIIFINQKFSQSYLGNQKGSVRYIEFFDSKEIKPALYILYTFPIKKFEPFLSIGTSFRTNLSDQYYRLVQSISPTLVVTTMDSNREFVPVRFNLLVSGGLKIRLSNKIKVSINARAEGGIEGLLDNESTVPHKYFNIGILTGIQF